MSVLVVLEQSGGHFHRMGWEAVVAAKEGNDWAGPLLIALLVLLGAECFMAMFFGHYRRSEAVRTGCRVRLGGRGRC